ncbi:MAG: aminotransferase class I/II-fold pyridoxal phosphate-dependent enzyme [Methanoregula sp.]|nr:aminotransferase class I/II-fold pyridoxal phosphate-dependent enzyme [Methanoregula sp.]
MAVDFPKRVVHGGTGKRQLEKTQKKVQDFSASINPYPPRFAWHCDPAFLSSYPDDSYYELKERIGTTFHRKPEEICVGNGSIEIIRVFCAVVLREKKHFFCESPTFGEYALSACLAGAVPVDSSSKADVSFICNPNNPTGILLDKKTLVQKLTKMKLHDGMLFCDEAFIGLSDPNESIADISDPNLFVLQSLTKSFSVPGIRFGFGFGSPDLIEKIEISRPPWSVNAYAEAFAMEALLHMEDLRVARERIKTEREWLNYEIAALGLKPCPSSVNYILVECNRPVSPLCDRLAQHSILIRNCTSFGLPTCIRVAVRTHEENILLIEAFAKCMR